MNMYPNIRNSELPCLLRVCYEENNSDMERAAQDIETISQGLNLIRMKSIINSRSRKKETRWSRGRDFRGIMENLILQNIAGKEVCDNG